MKSGNFKAVLAGALAVVSIGCSGRPAPSSAASPSSVEAREDNRVVLSPNSLKLLAIRTVAVQVREIPEDVVTAPGKVEINPNRVSRVLMPMPGRIRAVLVRLGDTVAEGQALVTVESPEANAAFAASSQADARLRQAISAQAKAEKDLGRVRDLHEHRAAALKDVVGAENDLVQAEASVSECRAELEEARGRLDVFGLKAGGGTREVTVRAPIAGKVLEIAVVPGEYRNDTSASLMTVADLSTVWVTSNVPEGSIRLIQPGEPIVISLVAYPGEPFHGRVTRIADMVDPETRTVKVQAELANPTGRLRPEMFGSMLHSHGVRSVPLVPASAVVRSGQGAFVYREKGEGVFERTEIKAGDALDGFVPVLSGLRGGERVVADGAVLLGSR